MTAVPRRLVTIVEIDVPVIEVHSMSVSARLEVELTDGRRVTVLDGRGWSVSGPADVWSRQTFDHIAEDARVVVGPDEPHDDLTREDMAADHWGALAEDLARHGIAIDPDALAALPHDVDLGPRLRAQLGA